jgi:hypothetical protein
MTITPSEPLNHIIASMILASDPPTEVKTEGNGCITFSIRISSANEEPKNVNVGPAPVLDKMYKCSCIVWKNGLRTTFKKYQITEPYQILKVALTFIGGPARSWLIDTVGVWETVPVLKIRLVGEYIEGLDEVTAPWDKRQDKKEIDCVAYIRSHGYCSSPI